MVTGQMTTYLNHFTQPDSIIPNLSSPQSLNRYSYVSNQPINFNDPSGNMRIGDGPESSKHGCSNAFYCAKGKPYIRRSGPHPSTSPNPRGNGTDDVNWNIQSPNTTLYKDLGYDIFGGVRITGQIGYTENNGSNWTVSFTPNGDEFPVIGLKRTAPIAVPQVDANADIKGVISANTKFDSTFGYQDTVQGDLLNHAVLSTTGLESNFNPWNLAVSSHAGIRYENTTITGKMTVDYQARPDNLSLVAAPVAVYVGASYLDMFVLTASARAACRSLAPQYC